MALTDFVLANVIALLANEDAPRRASRRAEEGEGQIGGARRSHYEARPRTAAGVAAGGGKPAPTPPPARGFERPYL